MLSWPRHGSKDVQHNDHMVKVIEMVWTLMVMIMINTGDTHTCTSDFLIAETFETQPTDQTTQF